MTTPNTTDGARPATSVTPSTSVGSATSVAPATSVPGTPVAPATGNDTGAPYVAASQTVAPVRQTLPADHPQVLAASAPPPPPEAYERASLDPAERARQLERDARRR